MPHQGHRQVISLPTVGALWVKAPQELKGLAVSLQPTCVVLSH